MHPKTVDKIKRKLKELTGRSNGLGYDQLKSKLKRCIDGWMAYFYMAECKSTLETIDGWLRRRIRMFIWKRWKFPKTRCKMLVKCGIPYKRAYALSYTKGYWRVAGSWVCNTAMSNERLYKAGYSSLTASYYAVRHK